jgi:Gas vesicle protein G
MGLITGLLTLPLAPVRATAKIGEIVQEQAEAELYDEDAIQAQMVDLEEAHEAGLIDDDELAEAENALLERLIAARERTSGEAPSG